jgi:FixJ family two-component response regulator
MLRAERVAVHADVHRRARGTPKPVEQPGVILPLKTSRATPIVYIVDNNAAEREKLGALIESAGLAVRAYPNAETFLGDLNAALPACLVLEQRLPGMSGLELQSLLERQGTRLPIVFISSHATIPLAVRAMRHGALDFFTKPLHHEALLTRIRRGLAESQRLHEEALAQQCIYARLALLSQREREVLDLVVEGKTNKAIARALEISIKTVESHRGSLKRKLKARSLAELVCTALPLIRHQGKP